MTTRVGPLVAAFLLAACTSKTGCTEPDDCHDLLFRGQLYDEYQVYVDTSRPGDLQEVGNATYPECNCAEQDLDGLGATDVWQYGSVDNEQAVIGYRQDTHTYVVFVRVDVDPGSLPTPGGPLGS